MAVILGINQIYALSIDYNATFSLVCSFPNSPRHLVSSWIVLFESVYWAFKLVSIVVSLCLKGLFLVLPRLANVHSLHPKCSRCVLGGSLCNNSSRCDLLECKCQAVGRFQGQEASVKYLPGECLASSSSLGGEVQANVLEVWLRDNKCVVLEQCKASHRGQRTSFSRMSATNHRHIQEQCPCRTKNSLLPYR